MLLLLEGVEEVEFVLLLEEPHSDCCSCRAACWSAAVQFALRQAAAAAWKAVLEHTQVRSVKVAQVLGLTAPAKQLSIHASWADTPMAVATARVAKMRRGLTSIASVGEEEESDGRELTGAWVTLVVLCNLGDIRFDILLTVETRRQFPLLTFFCRSSHGIEKEFNWLGRLS